MNTFTSEQLSFIKKHSSTDISKELNNFDGKCLMVFGAQGEQAYTWIDKNTARCIIDFLSDGRSLLFGDYSLYPDTFYTDENAIQKCIDNIPVYDPPEEFPWLVDGSCLLLEELLVRIRYYNKKRKRQAEE